MELRDYLNDIIYPELPQNWKTLIKEVEVLSSAGDTKADIVSSMDKLFLLSVAEICSDAAYTDSIPYKNEIDENAETIAFEIFTDNDSRYKKYINGTGSGIAYATRSPALNNATHFNFVRNGGSNIYMQKLTVHVPILVFLGFSIYKK